MLHFFVKRKTICKNAIGRNLLRSPSPSFKYISITQSEVHVRMIELIRIQNCRGELSLQFHLMTFSVVWHIIQYLICLFVTKKQLKLGFFAMKNFYSVLF